jgi:hypothetical protein
MKKIYYYIAALSALSCNQAGERQSIIDAAIREKVENFTQKRLQDQRQKELEKAIAKADSILLLNADLWQLSMDSLRARPPRAIKPSSPNITIHVDSTPAQPLFPSLSKNK